MFSNNIKTASNLSMTKNLTRKFKQLVILGRGGKRKSGKKAQKVCLDFHCTDCLTNRGRRRYKALVDHQGTA
jgi:hypothetical protein